MSSFVCQGCGAQSPSWIGKCPVCEEWNTYVEENTKSEAQNSKQIQKFKSQITNAVSIDKIDIQKDSRTLSGIGEFDRVLGGGILKGAVTLVAGEPGTGKSTLMLQLAASLAKKNKVLYVSGEESLSQIKVRAQRLAV
ncbi:MAG: ATPase domain-containing protein, partial [Candidatus Margulisiibacteriota bacterium]